MVLDLLIRERQMEEPRRKAVFRHRERIVLKKSIKSNPATSDATR